MKLNKKFYLSIDMDYFNEYVYVAEKTVNDIVFIAKKNHIPVHSVMNHQQLLPYANECGAKMLINVDRHSDLYHKKVQGLGCGSWVSYVDWRRTGSYLWIRDSLIKAGSCNFKDPDISYETYKKWNAFVDWKQSSTVRILPKNLNIDMSRCVGVGICMSPWYSLCCVSEIFRKIVVKNKLPYKKGNRLENNVKLILPP
jgi:hypothetical protein